MSSLSNTDYAKPNWNPHLLFFIFPPHFRNRGKYFALSLFRILNLDIFDFSHDHGWLKVLDIIMVMFPWPLPDSRRTRRLLLWREVWVWPQAVEAPDSNFQGSPVLPFPFSASHSFSSSLLLLVAEAISLCPQTTSLSMGYRHLPTLPRSSETTLANTATGTTSPETVRVWRWRGYLLNAVDTVLYPQRDAPMQHCSVPSLGTVLQGLMAVGLYLHLPK